MASPNQRKRPAPGASPSLAMHPLDNQYSSADHFGRWNSPDTSNGLAEDGSQAIGSYGMPQLPAQYPQPIPATPSNMLARRQMNRALVPTGGRATFDNGSDPWSNSLVPADTNSLESNASEMNEQDSLAQLEQQALKAKREAEAKRKQIPPFVQKLSSFLNEGKNQELIRWSEKGDSFIVVDEEEFAKKLIPELFKHNNYASFVRQLNMYGFHKRVGLSDNSMRASERKNKSPSEYSNPYFRRGHPNLLWLITKPKSNSKAKKATKSPENEADSEEEVGPDETPGYANLSGGMSLSEIGGPKKDISVFRDEFKKIREHQQLILQRMQRLEQNQQRIEQQQRAQQQQKDQRVDEIYRLFMRHENSLQNMMQILMYHFKKTLGDGKSAQQIKDIMASGFLQGGNHGSSHGVVELDDLVPPQPKSPNPMGVARRTPRLLEAPPSGGPGSVKAESTPSATPHFSGPEMGTVTEILENTPPGDSTSSPYNLGSELDSSQQEHLLRLLHDANNNVAAANAIPQMNSGMQSTMPGSHPSLSAQSAPQPSPASHHSSIPQPRDSASATSTGSVPPGMPPSTQGNYSAPSTSAPPVPPAPSMPAGVNAMAGAGPDMSHHHQYSSMAPSIPRNPGEVPYNSKEYENLKKLQAAQDASIQLLGSKIAPLSPSGQITGFNGGGGPSPEGTDYFSTGNFDLNDPAFNEFINSDPFSHEGGGVGGDGAGYDFDLGLLGMPKDQGVGEAGGGQADGAGSPERSKRRKMQ